MTNGATTNRNSARRLAPAVVVATAAAALAAIGCAPAKLDGFLYDPLPAPPGGYQLSTAVIPGWQELHVPTPDGETLQGYFIPSGGARPDITVIYFHGQSNNVGTTWPRLEYLYPLGYNLVAVDVRGYGQSTGTPDEPGLNTDVRAIWQATVDRADVDGARIVIYGRSFGAALAIELATAHAPAVLVTESAFASVAALVRDGAYVDFPRSFVARAVWDNLGKIGSIASPYLALHGDADPYVLSRYSHELTEAHRAAQPAQPTTLLIVPGADHGNVPQKLGLDAYRETLRTSIEGVVGPRP